MFPHTRHEHIAYSWCFDHLLWVSLQEVWKHQLLKSSLQATVSPSSASEWVRHRQFPSKEDALVRQHRAAVQGSLPRNPPSQGCVHSLLASCLNSDRNEASLFQQLRFYTGCKQQKRNQTVADFISKGLYGEEVEHTGDERKKWKLAYKDVLCKKGNIANIL